MSDIDLLVPVNKLAAADGVLTGLGYQSDRFCNFDDLPKVHQHVPTYTKPSWPAIEIHCQLMNPKRPCRFASDEVWRETEPIRVENTELPGLSKEFLLLHICAHVGYGHGFVFGLQPFCDMGEIVSRYRETLDWRAFAASAIASGGRRGIFLALLLAGDMLGVPVPEWVMKKLMPSGIDPETLSMARSQVLGESALKGYGAERATILQTEGVWKKGKAIGKRLFLSKKHLANNYGVPSDNWRVYLYYGVRLKDVFRRHKRTVMEYARGDGETRSVVERIAVLDRWMNLADGDLGRGFTTETQRTRRKT